MTTSDDLQATVEHAATRLVAELRAAEGWTEQWRNRRLSRLAAEAALGRCLERLATTGCWGEANRLPSQHLWRIAGPLLERGAMLRHARFKPFGYAGDHQMLSRIWERWCCDDPLGWALDDYFQRQAAPEAVRARIEQVAAELGRCLPPAPRALSRREHRLRPGPGRGRSAGGPCRPSGGR